ncbi:MAG: MFS transporter [Burkholderiales bacterium]|nr:MAG: MFS transporter [Burkholderiales bacterium]
MRRFFLILNVGHALDHLVLLVFAAAVARIAVEMDVSRWEDLMPWATGAFLMFGLGALPAGWLADHVGRRPLMIVFFVGTGLATIAVALARTPLQLGAALTLMGSFAAIYHPVGIPMLVQHAGRRAGWMIGVNGLAGNVGVALAAASTGLLVKVSGWQAAFVVPGLLLVACGWLFHRWAPPETEPPARRQAVLREASRSDAARAFVDMTLAAICASLAFNFTTNANPEMFRDRLIRVTGDPALLGAVLAAVYLCGSLAQLLVGHQVDRHPVRRVFLPIALSQIPVFLIASQLEGWAFVALAVGFMLLVFGQIPFGDAVITRYFDDRMRSRVYAVRLGIGFGSSATAVAVLGPMVKASGFDALLLLLAGVAVLMAVCILLLPPEPRPATTDSAAR